MSSLQREQEIRWLVEEKYGGKSSPEAEADVRRLEQGEHIDYVIGFVKFLGCTIGLSKRPFIPRPETEYWVEKAIKEMKERGQVYCLDLFSGSGCVGIAVLKHVPQAMVDFAEKDERFLEQIQKNLELNDIDPTRYRVIQSDIFSSVPDAYDYILANPPYIAESRSQEVQESVLEAEPRGALFGGSDGLLYIKKFLAEVEQYLKPGGKAYMEFDDHQKDAIAALKPRSSLFRDQYKKWRYLVVQV